MLSTQYLNQVARTAGPCPDQRTAEEEPFGVVGAWNDWRLEFADHGHRDYKVDLSDVFGAAALGTIINVGAATTGEQPALTFDGVGITCNHDPVIGFLRDGLQRSASVATNRVVDRSLAIEPTIKIVSGSRVSVLTTRRLTF